MNTDFGYLAWESEQNTTLSLAAVEKLQLESLHQYTGGKPQVFAATPNNVGRRRLSGRADAVGHYKYQPATVHLGRPGPL